MKYLPYLSLALLTALVSCRNETGNSAEKAGPETTEDAGVGDIQLLEEAETFRVNLVFLELTGPNGQLTFRNDRK